MGPEATILLPHEPTDVDRATLRSVLTPLGSLEPETAMELGIFVETTRPIGGRYSGEGRFIQTVWQVGEDFERENLHWPTCKGDVADHFGFAPAADLGLWAGVNRSDNHQVLGELTLHLARTFGGVVDFGGALMHPESWMVFLRGIGRGGRDWSELAAPTERMLAALPGRVVAIEYKTSLGGTWVHHVGDVEFLAGWLEHPSFHMIK